MTDVPEKVRLTKAQKNALRYIEENGPGTLPPTSQGRTSAAVSKLIDGQLLETLNRLRPGPPMYEITPAGRAALHQEQDDA